MFVFAILFFGVMTDAGMLEPIISWLLRTVGAKPSRIVPGTALLALILRLDGSGAVVFLIAIPALLPLYQRVGIDKRILACAVSLAVGVTFLPWTGTTLRAAAALHITPAALFVPLIGVQVIGLAFVFLVTLILGLREERRIGQAHLAVCAEEIAIPSDVSQSLPKHFYINLLVTLFILGVIVSGKVDPVVMFMVGTILALLLNFHSLKAISRKKRGASSLMIISIAGHPTIEI